MRRSAGRPTQPADCQIAAVARSRSMTVATRNVRDFEGMGIDVVDPYDDMRVRLLHRQAGRASAG